MTWFAPLLWCITVSPLALLYDAPLHRVSKNMRLDDFVAVSGDSPCQMKWRIQCGVQIWQRTGSVVKPGIICSYEREMMELIVNLASPAGYTFRHGTDLLSLAKKWLERDQYYDPEADGFFHAQYKGVRIVRLVKGHGERLLLLRRVSY